MAAKRDCSACSDLQENAPEFVQNGVTTNVCNSLKNDTGFNPSSGNNDCTDLNDANDCLIGNMEDEVDAYDVCEWKEFMPKFIHNLWNVLKAMICAICGIWKNIHKHDCEINSLLSGKSFHIGEEPTDGSYVVAGQGISFLQTEGSETTSDISLFYIAGGLLRVQGSLNFHHAADFTDAGYCYNFDTDGTNPVYTKNRKKNTVWDDTGALEGGGELLFEIRIKKSQFPEIKNIYSGIGAPTGGGAYQVNLIAENEGGSIGGQHGHTSPTHTVPSGWMYVQARMINIMAHIGDGNRYSPRGFMGIRFDRNKIECD